ncbi:MAG: amidohydrolase [Candidatus Bathyarchaeia archaeon]
MIKIPLTIFNATIITLDKERRIIENGSIVIENDRIVDVGSNKEIKAKYGDLDEVIDASNMIAIPGLINAHTHMFQSFLRGLGDDLELMIWLKEVSYPIIQAISDEDVYIAALLGCVEQIKTGTTYVIDNHYQNSSEKAIDNVAKAIIETGMKGLIARGMRWKTPRAIKDKYPDFLFPYSLDEEINITEKLIRKWNKKDNRVKVCPAPINTRLAGPEMFLETKKLSEKYNVPVHTHISETQAPLHICIEDYGKREIELLYELNVLNSLFHVVHGVWLNDQDIKLMAMAKANLIHCPVSNMILASGVAPIPKMLEKGVNVALATDGPASNNNQDMILVLKFTALLHKVSTLNPLITPCEQVLEMATLGGAKALSLENEIGSIEVGKKADIVLIGIKKPHIWPVHRPVSALVYCANGLDVAYTIIDGKVVYERGKIKTVDEESILEKAKEHAYQLVEKAGITKLKKRSWPTLKQK